VSEIVYEKLKIRGMTNVEIHSLPAESMPFDPDTFDLIVSNNGLNNVQDLQKVLSECRRVSKQDGQLVFTMNLPDTMIEFYRIFERVLNDFRMLDVIDRMRKHIDNKRKPLNEMHDAVEQSGFTVVQTKRGSFSYRFVDAAAMFDYYTIREFFLPSWKEIIPRENVPVVFSKIAESLNELARSEGEIRLTIPFVCLDCSRK